MNKALVAVPVLLLSLLASAQQTPPGWSATPATDDKAQTFKPGDLAPGEDSAVVFYPRTSLGDASVDKWLVQATANDPPPPGGAWVGEATVEPKTANLATATRLAKFGGGTQGLVMYLAVSIDRGNVRLARWASSSMDVAKRYQKPATGLMSGLAKVEKDAAVGDRRGTSIDTVPPPVEGIKPGGDIVPGKYVGNFTIRDKIAHQVVLLIYENGEYEYLTGGHDHGKGQGTFKYEPGTGKLDAYQGPCSNNKYRPDEEFCFFGRDAKGNPVIHAEDNYASNNVTHLRREGDVGKPSPSAAKQMKKAADAEARRYKFVTDAGRGVKLSEIEAVLYEWRQVYEIGGLQLRENCYLALKDGTIHDGLPVAPQDMDVGLSKRKEPEKWGRWKRSGDKWSVAWRDKTDEYLPLSQVLTMRPFRDGSKIDASFTASSSYSIPGASSAWSKWGVSLKSDGRFEKFSQGGASSGGPGTGFDTMTSATYDDKGIVTSASAPNFAGGSSKKYEDKGDRTGTYALEGYAVLLRYDNGTVARLPSFTDDKQSRIWLEGALMVR